MKRNNGRIDHEEDFSPRQYRRESSKLVPFTLGAIVGGVIGAAIALLYAPAEGSELRRGMSEKLDDLTEGAKNIIRGAKSTAEKLMREVTNQEDFEDEEPSPVKHTRARADDILEDADRAMAEARRRSSGSRIYDTDED